MSDYKTCGGCGATRPEERCIGCLHNFGGGSWDTDKIYDPGKVTLKEFGTLAEDERKKVVRALFAPLIFRPDEKN